MQPSFCIRVLERGRGRGARAHQPLYEWNPFPRGRSGALPAGFQAVFQTCGAPGLSRLSCRGPAPRWGWTARNAALLAKGQSDVEPETTWWKKARVYIFSLMKGFPVVEGAFLDCIWYFLSSSKPDPPCSKSGHFCSGYLWRERHAGEDRLLAWEETAILDEWCSRGPIQIA